MDAFRRPGLALAVLTLLLCLGAAAPQPVQKPEDFAGSWQLNEDLSQSSHPGRFGDGEHGRMGGGQRPGGGFPGGGPRGEGGGRFGRPPGEAGRPPLPPGLVVAMARGSKSLHIDVAGPQLTMTSGPDSQIVLFTDGRKVRKPQEQGDEIVQRTRWRDEHLEIETTTGNAKVSELWLLTNDRKRIFATVEMDMPGGRGKASFRRVWDRVELAQEQVPPS